MSPRPRILIGSSKEAFEKSIPQDIQIALSEWSDAQTWPTIFTMGDTTIESLEEQFPLFDAFVFVLTPDDILTMREQTFLSARDNILFEMGIAMGVKGRMNTFIIKQRTNGTQGNENGNNGVNGINGLNGGIKLPSDILGVNFGEFSCNNKADYETLSNKIRSKYFETHAESVEEAANEKIKDLSCEIREPIREIRETIDNIGKTLANEIAVLSGAQKAGIVNIYPNRYDKIAGGSLNDNIIQEFMTTQSTVCIQGISLGDYFLDRGVMHNYFMELVKRTFDKKEGSDCAAEPLHIKALIVDPKCDSLIERAYWEAGPEYCQDFKAYTDSTTYIETDGAARIAHRLQSKYSSLEVRCYTQAPTCFLILTSRYAFVENYTYASRGSSCPSIQIKEDNNDLYNLYKMHFDNLWETATPIDKYDPLLIIKPEVFKTYAERRPADDSSVK